MSSEKNSKEVTARSSASEISSFVEKARALAPVREARQARKGRLIFALDATMSRQPTWDLACSLQAEMFSVVDEIGTLEVQLNYYRGFRECRASKWASSAEALSGFMQQITCRGGRTQISKVLANARKEQTIRPVDALVFIGDAMEENLDLLCDRAGELGLLGVPMFVFQEGRKQSVERAFRELARLTNGAYQRFDDSAASELAALLRAVAVYATGGLGALEAANDRLLLPQLKGRKGR